MAKIKYIIFCGLLEGSSIPFGNLTWQWKMSHQAILLNGFTTAKKGVHKEKTGGRMGSGKYG